VKINIFAYLISVFFVFNLNAESQKILISGCGRSGTNYMAILLEKSGYSIHHECFGKDGCVSWPMAVNSYSPWGPISEETFDHVFHQVRHPLFVINSWLINLDDLDRDEWVFIRSHIPEINRSDSLIVHCAKYWYYWNLLVEQKAEWRYQIEKLSAVLPEFMTRSGLILDKKLLNKIPLTYNSWKKPGTRITWNQLQMQIPSDLYCKIRRMAFRYGYLDQPE